MGEGGDNTALVSSLCSVEDLVARGSVVEVELVRDDIRLSSLCTAERLELRVEVEWLASDGVRPVEMTALDGACSDAGLCSGPTRRLSISSSEVLTKAKLQAKS